MPHRNLGVDARKVRGLLVVLGILLVPGTAGAQDAGWALRFDGVSDSLRLGETAQIMAPTWVSTKTVSLWVHPTGTPNCTAPSPTHCDAIFGDRPRWWGISRGVVNGQDRLWVWNYDGQVRVIGLEYEPDEWIHVALVHDNGVLSAYRNGVLVGAVASGPTVQPNTGAFPVLHVGGIITNAQRNWTFEGEIDEVRLWDIARSPAEIAADMNQPLGPGATGLAAYYQMSDGSGLSVTDDSGRGWTASILDGGSGVPADQPAQWVVSTAFGEGDEGDGGDDDGGDNPPDNEAPTADPVSVALPEDSFVAIGLTGQDPDGDPLTFQITVPPAHGTLTGTAPDLIYTPHPDYFGPDTFTFVVRDASVSSAPAAVSLTVTPVNDAPIALDDSAVTTEDMPILINVIANDVDADGDSLTVTAVSEALNGTTTFDGTSVTYVPAAGFLGTDSFTYTVQDPSGASATATVTVTVGPSGNPIEVAALALPGSAHDVVVVGDFAYVAAQSGGLRIVDISDPLNPVAVGALQTRGAANCVFVAGGLAYVTNGNNGLRIVDVSDPTRPVEVGAYDTDGFAWEVKVVDNVAYVADRMGGLLILDVSNPMVPVELGRLATADEALEVAVDGHLVYVAVYTAGVQVVDVSDPANPTEVGRYRGPHYTYGVVVRDGYLYTVNGDAGLRLLDIQDPAAIREVGFYNTLGFSRSVALTGNLAIVADWLSGVQVVDITQPALPVGLGGYDTPGRARDVAVSGSYIYVADFEGGLRVLRY